VNETMLKETDDLVRLNFGTILNLQNFTET